MNAWIHVRSAIPSRSAKLEERAEVVDVRVDAAVRHEPEQVDVAAALARTPERRDERGVLRERSVRDSLIHTLRGPGTGSDRSRS